MPSNHLADDAVLIVIDMINDVVDPKNSFFLSSARELLPSLQELVEECRANQIPIVHSASQDMGNSLIGRHWRQVREGTSLVEGSAGVQVADELRPEQFSEMEVYLPKSKYSCFYGTRLDIILRNPPFRARNTLIVTGMNTNFCCMCTAIDAFNRDYEVLFVDDLNCTMDGIDGTPAETMHKITIETLKQGFVTEVLNARTLISRISHAQHQTARLA